MTSDPVPTPSDDPLDRALFGRRGTSATRAGMLAGVLFVITAVAFGMADRFEELQVFYGFSQTLVYVGGTGALVAITAAYAHRNEGLVRCWLLAFGPLFGAAMGHSRTWFETAEEGVFATVVASAIGIGVIAVVIGGIGFLVGYLARLSTGRITT